MTHTLLFAEDDDEDWMLIQEYFEEGGSQDTLVRVKNGEEVIHYLSSHPNPDLIFLDLKMPKMHGHEALEKIRSNPTTNHIPVIVMTASKTEADVYESYRKGANSYLPKPVTDSAVELLSRYWGELVVLPKLRHTP